jgi:hypothetical protein
LDKLLTQQTEWKKQCKHTKTFQEFKEFTQLNELLMQRTEWKNQYKYTKISEEFIKLDELLNELLTQRIEWKNQYKYLKIFKEYKDITQHCLECIHDNKLLPEIPKDELKHYITPKCVLETFYKMDT